MISYTWCERLGDEDRAAASALVATAARYDAEAGFTTIEPRETLPESAGPGETVWHLPIKARRDLSLRADAPVVLVAYLRLAVDADGRGSAAVVVDPRYRSRGVSTTLVEELGLDVSAPGGWCGTGATSLRGWAYGSHPAADRLTRRFGIRPVARLWTVLRHLAGPFAVPLEAITASDDVTIGELPGLASPAAVARVRDVLARAELTASHVDRFGAEFADGAGRVLIATDASGRDAGFVWFDPRPREHREPRTASVRALILAADARGAGLGAALLTRALEELLDGGAQLARMRVDPDDEGALRMLRLLSFEQEEAHTCYQVGERGDPPEMSEAAGGSLPRRLRVVAKDKVADGVVTVRLADPGGGPVAAWEPGAHIDLVLDAGLVRQYSLCGDPVDTGSLTVAVLREASGRGGSARVHDAVAEGDLLEIGGPRNHFALVDAPSYLFVAGGIGITPLLPMVRRADRRGVPWRLLYGGRTRAGMAFADELAAAYPDAVDIRPQEESGLLDIAGALNAAAPGVAVYCCGPEPLLLAVEAAGRERGVDVHVERFAPKAVAGDAVDGAFDVELRRTGATVTVGARESVIDALERAGVAVDHSCREGTCGTCEVAVLGGEPDHRDSVLTEEEQASGEAMMICVSRCLGSKLVLDL